MATETSSRRGTVFVSLEPDDEVLRGITSTALAAVGRTPLVRPGHLPRAM